MGLRVVSGFFFLREQLVVTYSDSKVIELLMFVIIMDKIHYTRLEVIKTPEHECVRGDAINNVGLLRMKIKISIQIL